MNPTTIYAVFLTVFYCGNAYCQPQNDASPFAALGAIAKNADIFNGARSAPTFSGQIALDEITIPTPTISFARPGLTNEKGVTNSLTTLILNELGNPPSKEEAAKIAQTLTVLSKTKIGKEICNSIGTTNLPSCTWEALKKAGVEITTRDLKYHLPEPLESILSPVFGSADLNAGVPKPSLVKGRTILCLDQELISQNSPAYIATYILHELAHVADNRTLGEAAFGTITQYATEYKAHIVQMMIYDEFLRTGALKGDSATNGIQFMLSVYRWKNGGPKPNMDYSVIINGKRYSAAEIISLLKPDDTGLKSVWRLTGFFTQLKEGAISERDLKYLRGVRDFIKELEPKYQTWFPSKPPVVVPPPAPQPPLPPQQPPTPPQQPQPPQPSPQPYPPHNPSTDDGDPVPPWPFNPNPHFQDGIK